MERSRAAAADGTATGRIRAEPRLPRGPMRGEPPRRAGIVSAPVAPRRASARGRVPTLAVALAATLALAATTGARAQTAGPPPQPEHKPPAVAMTPAEIDGRDARRFPQPVRVGCLAGRALLQPEEAQPVLGRVVGLVADPAGARGVVVRLDGRWGLGWLGLGWSGFGPRLVTVPIAAVALMGEHVALMDLTPEQLRALPTRETADVASNSADTVPADAIPADETVRIGIVRPFH